MAKVYNSQFIKKSLLLNDKDQQFSQLFVEHVTYLVCII